MPLFLLDRDGVVVVNQPTNVKTPDQLALIPGAAEDSARLNGAGFDVAICTNQPEVARGVLSRAQLDHVHEGLRQMLVRPRRRRAGSVLCQRPKVPVDETVRRNVCGRLWRATVQLRQTRRSSAIRQTTSRRRFTRAVSVLVRTGLGCKTLAQGLPLYRASSYIRRPCRCRGGQAGANCRLLEKRAARLRQQTRQCSLNSGKQTAWRARRQSDARRTK